MYTFNDLENLETVIQYRKPGNSSSICSFEIEGRQDVVEIRNDLTCVQNDQYDIYSEEFLEAMSELASEENDDTYCGKNYNNPEFRVIIDALNYKSEWRKI
jgi:hypothetical protein